MSYNNLIMYPYPPFGLLHVICVDTYYRCLGKHLAEWRSNYRRFIRKKTVFYFGNASILLKNIKEVI